MLLFYHLERLFFRNTHKMGRRSTALPPEKSKSIRILCGAFGVSASFVSVRLLVPFHQCLFYVGSPVENLAAHLGIGQNTVVSVVLQGSSAYFQQVCHFLVRQQFIAISRRLPFFQQLFEQGQHPVEIRVECLYPLVVLFSDFITHTHLILVIHYLGNSFKWSFLSNGLPYVSPPRFRLLAPHHQDDNKSGSRFW